MPIDPTSSSSENATGIIKKQSWVWYNDALELYKVVKHCPHLDIVDKEKSCLILKHLFTHPQPNELTIDNFVCDQWGHTWDSQIGSQACPQSHLCFALPLEFSLVKPWYAIPKSLYSLGDKVLKKWEL